MEKKYKLLRELPNAEAGAILEWDDEKNAYVYIGFGSIRKSSLSKEIVEDFSDWFSPVIPSKEELGGEKIEITLEKGTSFNPNNGLLMVKTKNYLIHAEKHEEIKEAISSVLNSKGIDNEGFVWTDELVLEFYKFANNADRNFTGFYSDLAVFKSKYSPKPADQVYEESIDKLYEKSLNSPTKEPYSKDWEIVEYKNRLNFQIYSTNQFLGDLSDPLNIYMILSVRRLSDGVLFTVGESLRWGKIKDFKIVDNKVQVHYYNITDWHLLSDVSKPLPVAQPKFPTQQEIIEAISNLF